MNNRARRLLADDDDDDPDDRSGWSRARRSNGSIVRDRRNGVSRDPLSEVKAIIQEDWRETLDDNFNPITLALDMLDTSSLGRARDLSNFKRTNDQIEQALQSTVNEHYQGFNTSIGTYGQINGSIKQSQLKVRSTKDALLKAKVQLSSKRMDLLEMSAKSNQYQDMIKLLREVADLRKVPEELEGFLSSKHFLHAVELLNHSSSIANRDDMKEISALGDIRAYLKTQSVNLIEILVEELHNHLYLKSPYCDRLWASYSSGQMDLPVMHYDHETSSNSPSTQRYSTIGQLNIEVHHAKQNQSSYIKETMNDQHPESDPFQYIQILTQALYDMGKLPYALEVMSQRLTSEISQTVHRTTQEVRSRHKDPADSGADKTVISHLDIDEPEFLPLHDLLWTLFSKWDSMLQHHRLLYDTVGVLLDRSMESRISSKSPTLSYDFAEIWRAIEAELRVLLNDYLTPKRSDESARSASDTIQQVFARRLTRERNQNVFSIRSAGLSGDSHFDGEEQELREMLQGSVPGLLSENNDSSTLSTKSNAFSETQEARGRVISATPLNIAVLLQPTMAFINRARRIVPTTSTISQSTLSGFLDEFLEKTFAPQLSETVDVLYQEVIGGRRIATSSNGTSNQSSGPTKESDDIRNLIMQLNATIASIPYNKVSYAHAVIKVITQYHQRCTTLLASITANEAADAHLGSLKLGPAWANRQACKDIWEDYAKLKPDADSLNSAVLQEITFLFDAKRDYTIRANDLMQDPGSIHSLVALYRSIISITQLIVSLPSDSPQDADKLDMDESTRNKFNILVTSYQTLSRTILRVIRLEIRAHILYYLQTTLSEGNYNIEEKASEVDSTLADMNADLLAMHLPLSGLAQGEYDMLTAGLAMLINEVLIEDSTMITIMTQFGSEKLTLGITALQQNLRNLVPRAEEVDLSKAKTFYEMFSLGPHVLTDRASSGTSGLEYPQAAKLMTLMYSSDIHRDISRGNRDSISAKRKQLNEHLAVLSSHMTKPEQA